MDDFEPMFVSHHQFHISTGWDSGDLGIYMVGDDLLHVCGGSALTGFTGPHTGWVQVRVRIDAADPDDGAPGWDAVSEATIWCQDGRLRVAGLMGHAPDTYGELGVPAPGLLRVQVRARDRRPDEVYDEDEDETGAPERFEVRVWPVTEDTGLRTLSSDGLHSPPPMKPGPAASWAMLQIVRATAGDGPRAGVRRRREVPVDRARALLADPAALLGGVRDGTTAVLRAGDLELRLRPEADGDSELRLRPEAVLRAGDLRLRPEADGDLELRLRPEPDPDAVRLVWSWALAPDPMFPDPAATLPDDRPSTVTLRLDPGTGGLDLHHDGVPGPQAVLLGLVWDHLLDRVVTGETGEPAWDATFRRLADEAVRAAEQRRRSMDEHERRRWGGRLPSQRIRAVPGNTMGLNRLDHPLLDALGTAGPEELRAIALWAARRGLEVAGLATVDWIAPALAAAERGDPPPPPFDDPTWRVPFDRMFTDPQVPQTVVTWPTVGPHPPPGVSMDNCSQQAAALPVLLAVGHADPLLAAVEALWSAAVAHGTAGYRTLFADARAEFPVLRS